MISSVQSLSCVRLFVTPWTAARQASLSITNSWSLLKLMSFESVMPSNHLNLCHACILLPSLFLSIRVFANVSLLCIRWSKYWSFSFNIILSMNNQDWFLLGWTGWISLQSKGLSRVFSKQQFKSINSSALSHLCGLTLTSVHDYRKAKALTIQTFVHKVIFLLFNMLSRFVIAFLPRSKHLLILWLQSPSAVILEPRKIKSVSIVSPSVCPEVMGTDAMLS